MTQEISRRTRTGRGAVPVVVLACAAVSALMQLYLVIPMTPQLQTRFGMSDAVAAWLVATFGLSFGIGNLFFGPFSDRHDRVNVMVMGTMGAGCAALLSSVATEVWMLFLARTIGGFFVAAFAATALVYLGETLDPPRRPMGIAVVSGCFLLAGLVGQGLGLLGIRTVDERAVFLLSAVPLFVVSAFVRALPRTSIGRVTTSIARQLRSATDVLRSRAILVSYLAAVTLLLAFVGLYSGIAIAGVAGTPGTNDLVDLYLLRLAGLPGIVLGMIGGSIIGRFGSVLVGTASLLLAAIGVGLVASADSVVAVALWSGVFVAGLAVAVPSVVATVGSAARTNRGTAMAGYGCFVGLGACAAPLLTAAVVPAGLSVLCLVLATMLATVAVIFGLGSRQRL